MKIATWKRTVQARADAEEAHVKPIDVKATEEAADGKAALGNETTKEATYEQKVTAWVERFRNKADGKKAKRKAARKKAALRKETIEESPLRKIAFVKGKTIEGSLPKKKAVIKGSLEVEEGGPTDQVQGTRDNNEPSNDHNDDLGTLPPLGVCGNRGPIGAVEQVQASKWSSLGGRPCH